MNERIRKASNEGRNNMHESVANEKHHTVNYTIHKPFCDRFRCCRHFHSYNNFSLKRVFGDCVSCPGIMPCSDHWQSAIK